MKKPEGNYHHHSESAPRAQVRSGSVNLHRIQYLVHWSLICLMNDDDLYLFHRDACYYRTVKKKKKSLPQESALVYEYIHMSAAVLMELSTGFMELIADSDFIRTYRA